MDKINMDEVNTFVDDLISNSTIKVSYMTIKTTTVCLTTPKGFELVGVSHSANKYSYDQAIGKQACMDDIRDRLIQFEIYRRIQDR